MEDTLKSPTVIVCGIYDLDVYSGHSFTHVVSMLDPRWPVPWQLQAFGAHHHLILSFHDVITPIKGRVCPEPDDVEKLLQFGASLNWRGTDASELLVHCEAGTSRSTAALTVLFAQANPEQSATSILRSVLRVRPGAWPNSRVVSIGDDLLGRKGQLALALGGLYRLQLTERPYLRRLMIEHGRVHEVELAEASPVESIELLS